MQTSQLRQTTVVSIVAILSLVTLVIDLLTPISYAEWGLYFVAIGVTLYQPRGTCRSSSPPCPPC